VPDDITDEQRAQIDPHMQKWADICHATGEADWNAWAAGARKCYGYAGYAWPGVIVTAPSPVAGSFLAGCLSHLSDQGKNLDKILPVGSTLTAWRDGESVWLRVVKPGEEVDDSATPNGRLVATGEVRSL
jgi:hypothetical protein